MSDNYLSLEAPIKNNASLKLCSENETIKNNIAQRKYTETSQFTQTFLLALITPIKY